VKRENYLGRCQVQFVAVAARHVLHLRIDLALVGFESKGQSGVGGVDADVFGWRYCLGLRCSRRDCCAAESPTGLCRGNREQGCSGDDCDRNDANSSEEYFWGNWFRQDDPPVINRWNTKVEKKHSAGTRLALGLCAHFLTKDK
jgi:hypothetical protein